MTERNKKQARIQQLLSSSNLKLVKDGLKLLQESADPDITAFFSRGLSIFIDRVKIAENSEISQYVKPQHQTYVALYLLNQSNQLQNATTITVNHSESITSVDWLTGCTSLKKLNLYGCTALHDLGTLRECPKLTYLYLTECTTLTRAMQRLFRDKKSVKKVLSMWEMVWKTSYQELLPPLTRLTMEHEAIEQLAGYTHSNPDIQALQRNRYIALTTGKSKNYLTQLKKMLNIPKIHPDVAAFIDASMHIKSMKTLTGLNGFAEKAVTGLYKNNQILKGVPHKYNDDDYFPALWLSSDMFLSIETGQVVYLHHGATFAERLHDILSQDQPPKNISGLVAQLAWHGGSVFDLRQLVTFEKMNHQTCKAWPSIAKTEQKKVFSNIYKIQLRTRPDLKKQMGMASGYEFIYPLIRDYVDG